MTATLQNVYDEVKSLESQLAAATLSQRVVPSQIVTWSGLSDINNSLGLVVAGEFRSGNGVEPGDGFSGVRMNAAGVNGYDNDVLQAGISATNGKITAGGGKISLENDGFVFTAQTTMDPQCYIRWINSLGDKISWFGCYENTTSVNSDINVIHRTGKNGAFTLNCEGDTGKTSTISLFNRTEGSAINKTVLTLTSNTFNDLNNDVDTIIKGDTDVVLTVDASADAVGIGVSDPDAKLEVNGTLHIQDTATLEKGLVVNEGSNDADTRIEGNGDANLVFVDAGNDRVGIGVNDPDSKLEVNGTLHASGATTLDSSISVGGGATLSTITSGVWTPGLTNTTNISSSTAHEGQYLQVGDMVHCSVAIDITPTAGGAVELRLDPPIVPASNFADAYKGSGTGACQGVNLSGGLNALASTKKIKFAFVAPDTTARTWRITFTYQIA